MLYSLINFASNRQHHVVSLTPVYTNSDVWVWRYAKAQETYYYYGIHNCHSESGISGGYSTMPVCNSNSNK